ncbi:MAG TPA: hypothetical protein VK832_19745, partial [Burkholderiaceae bacterium]|nr:hypothetical protein [Burkholderiaceae bacterium]
MFTVFQAHEEIKMSISGIGNSNNAATSAYSGVSQIAGQSADAGSSAANGVSALGTGSQGGQLTAALMQALAQLGVSPTAASTGSSGSGSSSQDS